MQSAEYLVVLTQAVANAETRPQRIVRDPQGRELEEWEEQDAFEPNGVLKDGYSLRVPLYMKDGTPVDDGFSHAMVDSYKRGRKGVGQRRVG